MNLHELGIKHGTDKTDKYHSFRGNSYLDIYEKYFSSIKDERLNILEIGSYGGNSLRLWKEYFSNASIYGIDIDPNCKNLEEERVKIFIGSQDDNSFLQGVVDECGTFDIIIDDGSHINDLTLASYNFLINHVNQGGLYIMEDLHCSYEDLTNAYWGTGWDINKDKGVKLDNERRTVDDHFVKMLHEIDHGTRRENDEDHRLEKDKMTPIQSLHFYCQLAIVVK